jgi:GTPase SAR1 family protein
MIGNDDENQKFDIKVALIGYISVGKTTVLNALLRDKYGEVAMGRATASVNHYAVAVAAAVPTTTTTTTSHSPTALVAAAATNRPESVV